MIVIWMTVQYPMMERNVCRVSWKYAAAHVPTTIAATKPNVTRTIRGILRAHGPKFCA